MHARISRVTYVYCWTRRVIEYRFAFYVRSVCHLERVAGRSSEVSTRRRVVRRCREREYYCPPPVQAQRLACRTIDRLLKTDRNNRRDKGRPPCVNGRRCSLEPVSGLFQTGKISRKTRTSVFRFVFEIVPSNKLFI